MTSQELREKFLNFFNEKGHAIIPSASLIPEGIDPTALFIAAGMQPLVRFLLGEKHLSGKRVVNCQTCVRTDDIDEVGDAVHHTFFEMLGNWSFGDYFKEEAIKYSFEFLTSSKWLGIKKEKLAVSIFEGDNDAPRDDESKKIWMSLGVSEKRIKELPKKDNWWGPAGQTGPCGPDTEMFYWSGGDIAPEEFDPKDKRWVEIWNNVFMQYKRLLTEEGQKRYSEGLELLPADFYYELLKQKNVDTGMGLERTLAALNGLDDNYKTDLFLPIIKKIEELSNKKYEDNKKEFRIIADHIKAATFIIGDKRGVEPSNVGQGYVVRRLIRRAIGEGNKLEIKGIFTFKIAEEVIKIYQDIYSELRENKELIINQLVKEEETFEKTKPIREKMAIKELEKRKQRDPETQIYYVTGDQVYETYGMTGTAGDVIIELAKQHNIEVRRPEDYEIGFKRHQELSRTASAGMFKGGLADAGEQTIKYHTATHLLLAAIRQFLGSEIYQKGSNITAERLRFDFNYPEKLTEEQIKKIEDLVNEKIKEDILVGIIEMSKEEALKIAKISFDVSKYGDKVKVYKIGDFSIELCGGPHVKRTSELGHFKIIKEESSSAGVRRIKAILE